MLLRLQDPPHLQSFLYSFLAHLVQLSPFFLYLFFHSLDFHSRILRVQFIFSILLLFMVHTFELN